MTPESTNSETWVLTEEDQSDAYKCVLKLQALETNLSNCEVLLKAGRFIDCYEDIGLHKRELKTAIADLQAFVKTLQDKGVWVEVSKN